MLLQHGSDVEHVIFFVFRCYLDNHWRILMGKDAGKEECGDVVGLVGRSFHQRLGPVRCTVISGDTM